MAIWNRDNLRLFTILAHHSVGIEILPGDPKTWLPEGSDDKLFLYEERNLGIPHKVVYRAYLEAAHIFYNARKKGPIKDYKAGNLNANLMYSRSLPFRVPGHEFRDDPKPLSLLPIIKLKATGKSPPELLGSDLDSSEYVAGLDADMIPEPNWRKYASNRSYICLMIPAWRILTKSMEYS